jgi:hypothetical protein
MNIDNPAGSMELEYLFVESTAQNEKLALTTGITG